MELKARFDERRNIDWARALEEAGAHVVHGLPGLKTHAKALLVVRREGNGVRHYVHVGTGNYHAKTARLYEDFGLFTADRELGGRRGRAVQLADRRRALAEYRKGVIAPDHMRDWFLDEVHKTIEAKERGRGARIVLKMNSLVDTRCIRALYEASQAGVRVDLNVRGICCLRAGLGGRVREHPRGVGGRALPRALAHLRVPPRRRAPLLDRVGRPDAAQPRHRVELLAPVEDPCASCRPSSRTRSSAAWPTTPSAGSSALTPTGHAAPAAHARCTTS